LINLLLLPFSFFLSLYIFVFEERGRGEYNSVFLPFLDLSLALFTGFVFYWRYLFFPLLDEGIFLLGFLGFDLRVSEGKRGRGKYFDPFS